MELRETLKMDRYARHDGASIELEKIDAKGKRRFWTARCVGSKLETKTYLEGKTPKPSTKSLSDAYASARAYHKAVASKLRSGYVFRQDPGELEPRSICFAAFASGGGGGPVLDLSLDGTRALTAGHRGAPKAVWLETIDTDTGARHRIFEREVEQGQLFLHSACFDQSGRAVVLQLEQETFKLDIESGELSRIASYGRDDGSQFNPFVVRPHFDGGRRRLVLFDRGSVVRVVDEAGASLLEVDVSHATTECRSAAISHSGKLLALYRASRGLIYGHDDAKHDSTNVVELWDIDGGELRKTFEFKELLDSVGLDAHDQLLMMTRKDLRGPILVELATGRELFEFDAVAYTWAWAPDGSMLATAGHALRLWAVRGLGRFEEIPIEDALPGRIMHVSFSSDGGLVASYEGNMLTLRRLR